MAKKSSAGITIKLGAIVDAGQIKFEGKLPQIDLDVNREKIQKEIKHLFDGIDFKQPDALKKFQDSAAAYIKSLGGSVKTLTYNINQSETALKHQDALRKRTVQTEAYTQATRKLTEARLEAAAAIKAEREASNSANYKGTQKGAKTSLSAYWDNMLPKLSGSDKFAALEAEAKRLQEVLGTGFKNKGEITGYKEQLKGFKEACSLAAKEVVGLKNEENKAKKEAKENADAVKKQAAAQELYTSKLATAKSNLENLSTTWSKFKQSPELMKEYGALQDMLAKGFTSNNDIQLYNQALAQFKNHCKAAGMATQSMGDKFRAAWSKFSVWLSASTIFMAAVNTVRKMIEEVKTLDSAMNSLEIVTNETDASYSLFLDNAIDKAKKLGETISNVVTMVERWVKLGYSLQDATKLSDVSVMFKNISGLSDPEQAVSAIVSALKAYNMEADSSIAVSDKLITVGDRYATDVAAIADGLQNAGATLSVAGNDIDQTIAMLTGSAEVTQDMDKTSTALRTMAMRIRGAKTSLDEASLDSEGMASSTSKLREELKALTGGFDIMQDTAGTAFKSTYDIMAGISKVYDKMSDSSQASMLELLAGKRASNSVAALIQNWDQVEKAYADSVASSGETERKYQTYMDSIQYRSQRLQASFQSLSSTVISSDAIKFGVDGLNALTSGLDAFIGKVGVIPTGAGIAGIVSLLKNFGRPETTGFMVPVQCERVA